jgi:amino acid permease
MIIFFPIEKQTQKDSEFFYPIEISAAATIINWWKPVLPDPVWSTIFVLLVLFINLVGVRLYGELEYWFALLKILIVLVFIIIGKYIHMFITETPIYI